MIPVFSPLTGLAGVVRSLFSAGEPGVWYDPSDLSTMYQDAAGTIPVTAVGQPVGLMLDKSKNGVGTNGTKRVNLLSYTEQFDKSAWVKTNATITANTSATTDPIGGNTADKLTETNAVSVHYVRVSGFPVVNGTSYVFSCFAKAAERSIIFLDCFDTVKSFGVSFNLLTGTVSGTRTGAGVVTPTITSVGNGWYRCQIVFTATATGTSSYWAQVGTLLVAGNFGGSDVNYAGDGTSGVFIWGADLRLSSEASTLPVYQRIDADWPSTIHGNHATQTTTASRPVLSARYNLLTKTEEFDAWTKMGTSVTPNQDGVADLIVANTNNSGHYATQELVVFPDATYKLSVKAKKAGYRYFGIAEVRAPTGGRIFDFDTGQFISTSGTVLSSSAQLQSDGYWLLTITFTTSSTLSTNIGIEFHTNGVGTFGLSTGDGVSGALVKEASLTAVTESSLLPPYQRVNTATDYDTAGFPYFLSFDGVDDFLVTPSIDFTGTDKMTVFAGVRKLSDSARGAVIEHYDGGARGFGLSAPGIDPAQSYRVFSGGSIVVGVDARGASFKSPVTNVLSGIGLISGDSVILRINGTQAASSAGDQGTGNYGNYPLYIGRRGGTTLPFNGRLYGLIVRGAATDDSHLTHAEKYLAYKSGVSL